MTSTLMKVGGVVAGVAILAFLFGQRGDVYRVKHMELAVDAWVHEAYPDGRVEWRRIDDGKDPDRVVIRIEQPDGAEGQPRVDDVTFGYGPMACHYCRCWRALGEGGRR